MAFERYQSLIIADEIYQSIILIGERYHQSLIMTGDIYQSLILTGERYHNHSNEKCVIYNH